MTEYRFLLVSPNTDAVLEGVVIHQGKRKLDEMIKGNGLRDAYSTALARIKEQKGNKLRLRMEVLMCYHIWGDH